MAYQISKHGPLRRIEVDITQGEQITAKMMVRSEGNEIHFKFDLVPADILKLKEIIEAHTGECPNDGSRYMNGEGLPT